METHAHTCTNRQVASGWPWQHAVRVRAHTEWTSIITKKKERKPEESSLAEVARSLEVDIHLEAVEVRVHTMENELVFVLKKRRQGRVQDRKMKILITRINSIVTVHNSSLKPCQCHCLLLNRKTDTFEYIYAIKDVTSWKTGKIRFWRFPFTQTGQSKIGRRRQISLDHHCVNISQRIFINKVSLERSFHYLNAHTLLLKIRQEMTQLQPFEVT